MSQSLIEQLKKAREVRIQSGDVVFIITRPTDMDVAINGRLEINEREIFKKYVIGWDGVTERHIVASGDNMPAEFSAALFSSWIEDHPEHWNPIINGISEAYLAHKQRVGDAVKN